MEAVDPILDIHAAPEILESLVRHRLTMFSKTLIDRGMMVPLRVGQAHENEDWGFGLMMNTTGRTGRLNILKLDIPSPDSKDDEPTEMRILVPPKVVSHHRQHFHRISVLRWSI